MCSQDSFGLIAYNFEPEYSAGELEEIESIATGRYGENTVDDDFCTCLNCAIMSSTRENVCCRESELVLPNLDSYDCITDHPNFETIVLNPMVLEVSFIQMMVYKGHRGRAPDQLSNKKPVVLRGVDIGPCREKWTVEYLSDQKRTKEVRVHVSENPQMDFINKNFMYRSLPFCELVRRAAKEELDEFFISKTEKYYLRALGDDPRKDIANIHEQFPDLAGDIQFPDFYPKERFFSSVFRICSPGMQLWTHYDVMDNFLIQVQGRKRVILFHPNSVNFLYMNGDKSEVLDVDDPDEEKYPLFSKADRYEVELQPGDILFIPALWFHNVIALDFGIAVNVFWKHLDDKMYDTKDVYGNKDPLPASRSFQILDRALKTLEELPEGYRDFYARRLIARIETKALKDDFPT